ncbi:HpcH/HpaI aldolase/citrate lyase family protein [Dyella tabacisoli]|uniref:CoA ester lyase n=1 Tax=Dyella tabacisoli TaxID=2282381 RepID=A0A369UJ78_9GAMM|nr:CoA ester lyase [Dyella tabacisoli]RDD80403.1 CoA ester lyase [Dyella tabacisoli]
MNKFSRYCRSILFTPALVAERSVKATSLDADLALIDIEDSVAQAYKAEARARAVAFFSAPSEVPCRRAVRINNLGSPDGLLDLLALRECRYGPDVVMIPKVESPRDAEIAGHLLGNQVELIVIIETARGMENLSSTLAAQARLTATIFGAADFALSVGTSLDWHSLYHARARLVTATRAAGLHPIDSPWFDVVDTAGLVTAARRSHDLGYGGMAALHPRQVPIINEVFSPSSTDIEHARRVVDASGSSGGRGICLVDGMAVGAPFIEAAQRLLYEFDA